MKNNNSLYVGAFTLLFSLLIGIHAYYFYNSYKLKEKVILNTVHAQLSNLEDEVPYFFENDTLDDEIALLFSDFKNKKIDFATVTRYFQNKNQKLSPLITKYIDSLFQKQGYQIAIRKEVRDLISLPSKDTLINTPLVLYQTTTPISKSRTITEGKWTTISSNSKADLLDYKNHKRDKKPEYHFQINKLTHYDIIDLPLIVLKELIPLMVSSVLILILALVLYYLTYKNLVKHRQESMILHDIVDNISHEFKTPIATLKIAAKTLYKEDSLEVLPLIDRQIDRLEKLLKPIHIDEELDTALDLLEENDITSLLNDFVFSNSKIIFKQQIDITIPMPLYKIEAQTIIENLINNSIKYGANEIDIQINSRLNELEIIVSDDGIGMANNEFKHVFKKFYRIQKNNVQNTKGLGLGLYLVHKIVMKYHGTIQLKSKLNVGTTVKIKIPYEN
ncbi:HAMP domain-containing histidine kinase [Flavobacterium sp. F-65]|uniref:histidine kinase n=1 Tax=Flavobacterium pisciphilum TaxID=2893755 RepID=A0ABS8MWX4_9FLAO|nr:HAMP domain-containing sensor histidine kinase [Flavobacterium sp. F-65]MCC9072671.1 HAMP domain-containing histidine kinase [Flavobacterium sp. F-65]